VFIVFLPGLGAADHVELHYEKELGAFIYNPVADKVIEIKKNHSLAKFWLGALKSRRWDKMKLRAGEREVINQVIELLEGK
jgi:hypothetical protein